LKAANDAAHVFDAILVAGSIGAFLFASAVAVLLVVVVSRIAAQRTDLLGLAVLMLACGLGAVGLGLVAFESGGWSAAFATLASSPESARAAVLADTSQAMKPFATGAILVSMAIPVALVPPTGRMRIALAVVAIVVGGFALGTSATAHEKQKAVATEKVSAGT